MKIERTSQVSGITRTMDLDVTEEQMRRFKARIELIQDIFPNLTADEREFIKTGIIKEEFDSLFSC